MTRRSIRREGHGLLYGASVLAFLFTVTFSSMIYNTFATVQPPITQVGMSAEIVKIDNVYVLYDVRTYHGSTTNTIEVQRHVYQKDSGSKGFVIQGGFIGAEYDEHITRDDGTFPVLGVIPLPRGAQGTWCSDADIIWYPVLSLKAHRIETTDVCFEVSDNQRAER